MPNRVRNSLIALVACLANSQAGQACDVEITQPLTFVSLWNHDAAPTKEVPYQSACGKAAVTAACLLKDYVTTTQVLPAYAAPGDKRPFGAIVVRYVPGVTVNTSYLVLRDGENLSMDSFRLDMLDEDFFYGPYFHQTLLDRRGDWLRIALPDRKMPTGWISLSNPELLTLNVGEIVNFGDKSFVMLGTGPTSITVREEQPSDMWCDNPGDPPPQAPFKPITIPIKDLYDDGCRLLMTVRYTRGC